MLTGALEKGGVVMLKVRFGGKSVEVGRRGAIVRK